MTQKTQKITPKNKLAQEHDNFSDALKQVTRKYVTPATVFTTVGVTIFSGSLITSSYSTYKNISYNNEIAVMTRKIEKSTPNISKNDPAPDPKSTIKQPLKDHELNLMKKERRGTEEKAEKWASVAEGSLGGFVISLPILLLAMSAKGDEKQKDSGLE